MSETPSTVAHQKGQEYLELRAQLYQNIEGDTNSYTDDFLAYYEKQHPEDYAQLKTLLYSDQSSDALELELELENLDAGLAAFEKKERMAAFESVFKENGVTLASVEIDPQTNLIRATVACPGGEPLQIDQKNQNDFTVDGVLYKSGLEGVAEDVKLIVEVFKKISDKSLKTNLQSPFSKNLGVLYFDKNQLHGFVENTIEAEDPKALVTMLNQRYAATESGTGSSHEAPSTSPQETPIEAGIRQYLTDFALIPTTQMIEDAIATIKKNTSEFPTANTTNLFTTLSDENIPDEELRRLCASIFVRDDNNPMKAAPAVSTVASTGTPEAPARAASAATSSSSAAEASPPEAAPGAVDTSDPEATPSESTVPSAEPPAAPAQVAEIATEVVDVAAAAKTVETLYAISEELAARNKGITEGEERTDKGLNEAILAKRGWLQTKTSHLKTLEKAQNKYRVVMDKYKTEKGALANEYADLSSKLNAVDPTLFAGKPDLNETLDHAHRLVALRDGGGGYTEPLRELIARLKVESKESTAEKVEEYVASTDLKVWPAETAQTVAAAPTPEASAGETVVADAPEVEDPAQDQEPSEEA